MKHYPRYIIDLSRTLRKRSTPAEELLWQHLRRHKLTGLKFKRQHHIGRYIVDFYCHELNLIVELEGGVHETADQKEYDQERFSELDARGLRILRIKNEEVMQNMAGVLERILEFR